MGVSRRSLFASKKHGWLAGSLPGSDGRWSRYRSPAVIADRPILHLSLPVADLAAALEFYTQRLGCRRGRERRGWADVWFFGLQLTLQERPDRLRGLDDGAVRHFGVALDEAAFDELVERLQAAPVRWVSEPAVDRPGTPHEQKKCKIADPSGNVVEIKTYRDVVAAIGPPAP